MKKNKPSKIMAGLTKTVNETYWRELPPVPRTEPPVTALWNFSTLGAAFLLAGLFLLVDLFAAFFAVLRAGLFFAEDLFAALRAGLLLAEDLFAAFFAVLRAGLLFAEDLFAAFFAGLLFAVFFFAIVSSVVFFKEKWKFFDLLTQNQIPTTLFFFQQKIIKIFYFFVLFEENKQKNRCNR